LHGSQCCQRSASTVDAPGFTTRIKKYAVKNAPKSIASDAMNKNIPSTGGSKRELRFAGGGPWCS
jgi:hypothetical protein